MNKIDKKLIGIIVALIVLLFIHSLVKSVDIYYFIFSFSLFLLFVSSLSHINIENIIIDKSKKVSSKLFYGVICNIILINAFYIIIINGVVHILNSSNYFSQLTSILKTMGFTIFVVPILNILCQYLKINKMSQLSCKVKKIFYLMWIALTLSLVIIDNIFHVINYSLVIFIYISQLVSFVIILICCFIRIRNKNIFTLNSQEGFNKLRLKVLLKKIKKILSNNFVTSLRKMIYLSYYYLSIVIVSYLLLFKFNYDFQETCFVIADIYFYNFLFILITIGLIIYFFKDKIAEVINNIKNKEDDIHIDVFFLKLVKNIIPITILMCVLSGPILRFLFNSDNYSIFMFFVWVLPFLILYLVSEKFLEVSLKKKMVYLYLCFGIFMKLVLIVPLINAFYRMGYSFIYGDILSTIIGLFSSFIISIIYFNKKYKINFTKNFEKLLNIIYDNIVLSLILIVTSVIVPLVVSTRLQAIYVLLIYIIVYIVFNFVKKIFNNLWRVK